MNHIYEKFCLVCFIILTILNFATSLSYYLNVDFYKSYDENRCGNRSEWDEVTYEDITVKPYSEISNSNSVFKSSKESCITSFPISVKPKGYLEINVYVEAYSIDSGVVLELYDEINWNVPVLSFEYKKGSKEFQPKWLLIQIPLQHEVAGYINLIGISQEDEIVLVDYIRYVPDPSKVSEEQKTTTSPKPALKVKDVSLGEEIMLLREYDDYEFDDDDEDDDEEVTTGIPIATSEPPPTPEPLGPEEDNESMWNALTISLVAVAAFTGLALVAVGAYFWGKSRAIAENPPLSIEDIEPPRVITVPRARSMFTDNSSIYDRYN